MQAFELKITNTKNGLSKIIDVSNYKMFDFEKTFTVYVDAGFNVEILRGNFACIAMQHNEVQEQVKSNKKSFIHGIFTSLIILTALAFFMRG